MIGGGVYSRKYFQVGDNEQIFGCWRGGWSGLPPPPLERKPCELLSKEIVLQKSIVRKYGKKIVFFEF